MRVRFPSPAPSANLKIADLLGNQYRQEQKTTNAFSSAPVIIIGAGPSGLSVAACLKRLGVDCVILDRTGIAGGAFREMPRSMRLLSPKRYVHLPYFPYSGKDEYPSIPDYAKYVADYANTFALTAQQREVSAITKAGEGFEIKCALATGSFRCQVVVVATGMFNNPAWPEITGLVCSKHGGENPTIMHAHDWGREAIQRDQRILVIGNGVSGVSIAEECARAGAKVIVSRRAGRTRLISPTFAGLDILHWFRPFEFLPRFLFRKLCAEGVHPPAYDQGYAALLRNKEIEELGTVETIDGRMAYFANGESREADLIVAATGYRFETPFLPGEISRMPGGHPVADECESPQWPGLFFVGAPCARRVSSGFLRGIASDAKCVARQIHSRLRNSSRS